MTAPRPHRNWKYTKTTSLFNYITSLAGIAAAVEFVPEINGTACFGPLRNLTLCHRYAGTESDQYSPKSSCASNGWLTFETLAVESPYRTLHLNSAIDACKSIVPDSYSMNSNRKMSIQRTSIWLKNIILFIYYSYRLNLIASQS